MVMMGSDVRKGLRDCCRIICMMTLCDIWQQHCLGIPPPLPLTQSRIVFAAALRVALASAGVEELRIVVERQRSCDQQCNADRTAIQPAFDGENNNSSSRQRGKPQPQIDPARRQSLKGNFDSVSVQSAVRCSFLRTRSSLSASDAAVAVQRSCDADRSNYLQQPQRRSSDDSSGTSRWSAGNGGAAPHPHRHAQGLAEAARLDCDSTASVSSMSTDSGAPHPWVLSEGGCIGCTCTIPLGCCLANVLLVCLIMQNQQQEFCRGVPQVAFGPKAAPMCLQCLRQRPSGRPAAGAVAAAVAASALRTAAARAGERCQAHVPRPYTMFPPRQAGPPWRTTGRLSVGALCPD